MSAPAVICLSSAGLATAQGNSPDGVGRALTMTVGANGDEQPAVGFDDDG